MIAPDKMQLLQRFLGGLPAPVASRLAKAVEVDRLAEGKALPHDLILDGLRPVLRSSQSVRTLTPLRIFCRPFEDLLTGAAPAEKQKGRIARSSIAPVWGWLAKTLLPGQAAAYVAGVKAAVFGFHLEDAMAAAAGFWPVASEAMLEALASDAKRKAARRALVDAAVVADAGEMAQVLAVAVEVLEIQETLPKPLAALNEEILWKLRGIYDRIVEKAPDAAPYVAVIAMQRLERPWEALKLPLFVSRQTQDTLISSTDMGLVGEVIFAEIEDRAAAIRAARHPAFDAVELSRHVANFAQFSLGMVKEVEIRRNGKWGQRLMKLRSAVAEIMDGFMERAPREILAALPTQRASFSGGPRAPDLARAPDAEKRARALNYARLIAETRPFAAAGSFGASLKNTCDEVAAALALYNEEILRELRAAEGPRRENALVYLDLAAGIATHLLSAEEGELLRRRGRAALPQAAA